MNAHRFDSCIAALNACAHACDHCAVACLQESDPHTMARCIALDMDCAQLCRLTAGYLARSSELSAELCKLCARACKACAEECSLHSMDHCRRCAQACRECAEACELEAA